MIVRDARNVGSLFAFFLVGGVERRDFFDHLEKPAEDALSDPLELQPNIFGLNS